MSRLRQAIALLRQVRVTTWVLTAVFLVALMTYLDVKPPTPGTKPAVHDSTSQTTAPAKPHHTATPRPTTRATRTPSPTPTPTAKATPTSPASPTPTSSVAPTGTPHPTGTPTPTPS
jgi:hypothetical protein